MTNTVDAVVPENTPAPRSGLSRRRVLAGTAWAAPTIALAQAVPAFAASPDFCATPGTLFDAQSRGRLLTGTLAGYDLDGLVAVNGVHAQAFAPAQTDTQASPLSVTALGGITVNLGGAAVLLSDILTLLTSTDVGALNQYAHADAAFDGADTAEIGAAGAVNQASGAITLDENSDDVPQLATLSLYEILEHIGGPVVAGLLANIADLNLNVGAVAGRAWLDSGCTEPEADEIERDYLVAYLRLVVESGLVGDLVSALNSALSGLTISTDAVWDLLDGIPLLGGLLAALGRNALEVTATVNTGALLDDPLPDDPNAALQLDATEGQLTIDVASLLGGAYTGEVSPWLNSLPANSRLFIDYPLPTNAVADLLDDWLDSLIERLQDLVTITIRAGSVTGALATGLLIEGSLRDFLNGSATATFRLLGASINLGALLGPLVGDIGDLVISTIKGLFDVGGLQVAFTGINAVLAALFSVLEQVVVLTINAQNRPEADGGRPIPNDLAALEVGRYDVAALHVGALGLLDLLDLFVARGSVGANEPRL